MDKKTLKFVLVVFILWQTIVAFIIAAGARYFPTTQQYLYTEPARVINPPWLWSRANFDGIHYLKIAKWGYGLHQQAFFPLYPRLISILTPFFGGRDLLVGLMISWVSFLCFLFFLYKLVQLDFKEKIAKRTVFFLLIFPTAFFFSMVYTESLFMFLVLGCFYFARTRRWWLAGFFGGLASSTWLPGIFLFPALLVEYWQQKKKEKLKGLWFLELIPIMFMPIGLYFYMHFLATNYGDPFMFVHVQTYFGAGHTTGKLVMLYQVFWRYLKMLVTVDKMTTTYYVVVLEFLSGVSFLILTVFVYLKRWFSYATFMVLAYILPTLTGTFISMPRFVLTLFPGFILLSLWAEKSRLIRNVYILVSFLLFVISLILFTRGYWIA